MESVDFTTRKAVIDDLRHTATTERGSVVAADIGRGLDVYAIDGTYIGSVSEVWGHNNRHGFVPRSQAYLDDYGPIKGTSAWFMTGDGYIEVKKTVAPRLVDRSFYNVAQVRALQGEYLLVYGEGASERPLARPNRFHGLNKR